MTYTLAVDCKLLKCDDYKVEGNILTLYMKAGQLRFEKRIYEDSFTMDSMLLNKVIANYCNTYKIDGKTFKNCFPIYFGKNEVQLYFSDSIDIEKIKELIHD